MDLEREDRLELLFERAAVLPSGQRSAFVEAACGADGELRAILTALVADADDAHAYVERVAGPIVATAIRATLGDTSVGTHANGRNGGPDTFAGQHIDHFRVLDRLGSGGMGVVYKAIDVRLDRTVALKFLPPHLGTDEQAKRRFVHEAKAASALDHPNICAIHETGRLPRASSSSRWPITRARPSRRKSREGRCRSATSSTTSPRSPQDSNAHTMPGSSIVT